MYDLQVKQRNYKKYAIMSGCLMVIGLIWSLFLFPTIVVAIMKNVRFPYERTNANCEQYISNVSTYFVFQQLRLKPGYFVRKMYETVPFPLVFKIHIFDIQNKDGILKGEKPIFKEVGPYTFQ